MQKGSIVYEPKGRAREYAALAANLYTGCKHGCLYCFAPDAVFRERAAFHQVVAPKPDALARFERDCQKLQGSGQRVLLSFATDPYQPIDVEHRLTRQAIEIAHVNGLGVEILTKGGRLAMRDFDLLGPNDAFATTLTFSGNQESLLWEPCAELPDSRLAAMGEAHRLGIPTWVSLEPVIEPDQSLYMIWVTHEFTDHYKIGTWNYDKRAKVIDWADFGKRAVELLEKLGKPYYIKADLRARMEAVNS